MLLVLLCCAVARGAAQDVPPIHNDSPRIIFAPSPAVLIRIDGDPVYRDVAGTDLQRIVNTKSFIVREPSGTFYLRVRNGWMEAYLLTGDWTVAGAPPDAAAMALRQAVSARAVDLLEIGEPKTPDSGRLATGPVPTIYVSTTPTEFIVTDGPVQFVPFPGTALEYLKNTSAHVFREPTDGEFYVFASERWYRSWTTDGPWQFVVTRDLPADLAGISSASLKNNTRHRATDQR
jgi:hypothetical protein